MRRLTLEEAASMRHADSIDVGICTNPSCSNVHIQLCDEDNTPFAQCVITCEVVDEVVENLRSMQAQAKARARDHHNQKGH